MVTLRAAEPGRDVPSLVALARHPDVAPWVGALAVPQLEASPATEGEELLVVEAPDGVLVGAVRLVVANARSRIWAVETLIVDPEAQGRGIGVAALREVAARMLRPARAHRLQAEILAYNDAGLRTFARAGYVREGVRRRAWDRHGAWHDGVLVGLVDDDQPPATG